MDAAERWAQIERDWRSRPGIGLKKMLKSAGLTGPRDKVFASLIDGRLVLKLPADRVQELIASGDGRPFTSGSRVMREWVSVGAERGDEWAGLVTEAHDFAG